MKDSRSADAAERLPGSRPDSNSRRLRSSAGSPAANFRPGPAGRETPPAIITPEERAAIDRRLPAARAWKFSEHMFQRSLVRELRLLQSQYPGIRWLHAIPNGGHRGKAAAGKMKAEGQQSGVCDLSMPVPRRDGDRIYHGFYLELKKAGGSPGPEQWEWLIHLHRSGYAAFVANDPATARQLVTQYLSLDPP